ncbi:Rpn family recombination-promoting nuclease/putative transposase [Runella sp.]|jgi:predicted transposase/invertase (TIGR01784 family)|uniref:Rpn family recombination-promoting nuclease/putative transposase n=1 Tax=Runella sp. TaxID=1960881 RepID=UPI00260E0B4E|nr:Rpn family recombination-promoting nuclease/putative transposase [Runella sp.]
MPIDNVHDKFFKDSFSRKQLVEGLIQELFPKELSQKIDLSSLELSNNSYTDEKLEEHFADIVYQCTYQHSQKIRIALLFEHKSYQEKYPHFQLLRYLLNAWEQDSKEKKEPTLTIPIVIYHGKNRWKYQSIPQYFKGLDADLARFLPDFDYLLFDISQFSDEQIAGFSNKFLALSWILLKNSRTKSYLLGIAQAFTELIQAIESTGDMSYIRSVFLYVLSTTENLAKPKIVDIFRNISIQTNSITMTIAEAMKLEGKIQGKIEGKIEGKEEATIVFVQKLVKIGMDAATIAQTFELPKAKVEEIIAKM